VSDELDRRIGRLETEQTKMQDTLNELVLSTQRIGDLLEAQKMITPKVESHNEQLHSLELRLSNAQLVQKGFLWVGSLLATSTVAMLIAVARGMLG